jgi:succinoglycan biosynthesis transport protein ExoP
MELRDYLQVIRARRSAIIVATLAVALAALGVSLLQPKTYQGEARVLVSETDTGAALIGAVIPGLSAQPERSLQTQVQLMQLRPLTEQTIRRLNLGMTPDELAEDVEVEAVGGTNIVTIRAFARSPEDAAAIANVMAEAYVDWSRGQKRQSLKAAADEVDQRLAAAREEILAIGKKIQAQGKSDELDAELRIATGAYTTLAEKLEQLRINQQLEGGSGSIVAAAVVDERPVSPLPVKNTALGLVVGLVFGVAVAFLLDYLDNTVSSAEEAERIFGVPVLGAIPIDRTEKGEPSRRLVLKEAPGSAVAEAYRVLRSSLDFVNFERDLKTVLVTSAAPGEGKSTVSSNLAESLAQAGNKVVLVSSDFRRPTTEQFFDVNNMIGLSDVLLGAHSLKSALQQTGDGNLLVLSSGRMPPNPSELLGSQRMGDIMTSLKEWADWVIIDSSPLLAVADPAAVARWVDGVLLVSQSGVSTREESKSAVGLLDKVGARVVGVVMWGIGGDKSSSYIGGAPSGYVAYYAAHPQADAATLKAATSRTKPTRPATPMALVASALGRTLAAALAFVAVIAAIAAGLYVFDRPTALGIVEQVGGVVGGIL